MRSGPSPGKPSPAAGPAGTPGGLAAGGRWVGGSAGGAMARTPLSEGGAWGIPGAAASGAASVGPRQRVWAAGTAYPSLVAGGVAAPSLSKSVLRSSRAVFGLFFQGCPWPLAAARSVTIWIGSGYGNDSRQTGPLPSRILHISCPTRYL